MKNKVRLELLTRVLTTTFEFLSFQGGFGKKSRKSEKVQDAQFVRFLVCGGFHVQLLEKHVYSPVILQMIASGNA